MRLGEDGCEIEVVKCAFCGGRMTAAPYWDIDSDTDEAPSGYMADCADCGATGPMCKTELEAMRRATLPTVGGEKLKQVYQAFHGMADIEIVLEPLTLSDYQRLAQRTANTKTPSAKIENGILGLCGETGEIADVLKKYLYQGHELDREHMIEELGDVLWYCAELAEGLGVSLDDVAERNIDKLRRRYPEGFDTERSRNR